MGIKEGKPFLSPYKGGWGVGIEGTFIVTHWCINQTVNPRFSVLPRFPQLQIKRAAKEQPNPIQPGILGAWSGVLLKLGMLFLQLMKLVQLLLVLLMEMLL